MSLLTVQGTNDHFMDYLKPLLVKIVRGAVGTLKGRPYRKHTPSQQHYPLHGGEAAKKRGLQVSRKEL